MTNGNEGTNEILTANQAACIRSEKRDWLGLARVFDRMSVQEQGRVPKHSLVNAICTRSRSKVRKTSCAISRDLSKACKQVRRPESPGDVSEDHVGLWLRSFTTSL